MNVDDYGNSDFLTLYTSHSSRHSSPDKSSDQDGIQFGSPLFAVLNNSSEKQFCRRENIDQCIAYLNQWHVVNPRDEAEWICNFFDDEIAPTVELCILGFKPLFTSSRNGKELTDSFDIVRLVNSTYELLQLQQKNSQVRTSLEERNLRSECDNEFLVQNQNRLKAQVESLEREVAMCNERERQLKLNISKIKEQLKSEKDEVKKLKSNFQQIQNQINHENKKKEKEVVRLKERVHQMLTDKNQERKIGMEILNSLQRADGKRAMWNVGKKNEEEMYRLLVTNYEARQKELIKENNDLRDSLLDMQAELVSALNQQQSTGYDSDSEGCTSDECSGLSVRSLPEGHFNMPYELVREGIEKSLREKWRVLKSRLEHANKGSSSNSPQDSQEKVALIEEVEKSKKQLENYRHIVEQQEALIEAKENEKNPPAESSILSDSQICEEWERLKQEKTMFNEQKITFEDERRDFTEAASKLGYERKKFEAEKAHFIKQQLLITPQRKLPSAYKKLRSPDGQTSPPRLQYSTPMFSPAPREKREKSIRVPRDGPVQTPSTQDLYFALSLHGDDKDDVDETPKHTSAKAESSRSSSRCSSDVNDGSTSSKSRTRRINEHAEFVKRALQLKQGSPPHDG